MHTTAAGPATAGVDWSDFTELAQRPVPKHYLTWLVATVATLLVIGLMVAIFTWPTSTAARRVNMVQIEQGQTLASLLASGLYMQAQTRPVDDRCDPGVWMKVIQRQNPSLRLDASGAALATKRLRIGPCPPVAP